MNMYDIERVVNSAIDKALKFSDCFLQDRQELLDAAKTALSLIKEYESHDYISVIAEYHYGKVIVASDKNRNTEWAYCSHSLSTKRQCVIRIVFEDTLNPIRHSERVQSNRLYSDMVKFCEEYGVDTDYVDQLFFRCDNILEIYYRYDDKVKAVVGHVKKLDLSDNTLKKVKTFSFAMPKINGGGMIFVSSEYLDDGNVELTDEMCAGFLSPFFTRSVDAWQNAHLYRDFCEGKITEEDLVAEIEMCKLKEV